MIKLQDILTINDIKYSDDKEIKILAGSISIYDKMLEKLINF